MYHIKNDRRARASAERICAALLALLEEKPFEAVTIGDIQRVSTASRSTFYRNFDRLEDVLALLCDRGFQEAFRRERGEGYPVAVFRYWSENSSVLETLVSIRRTDLLFSSFRRTAAELPALRELAENAAQYDYFVSIITSGMAGILVTWIEHGKRETPDEVLAHVIAAFGNLFALGIPQG